MLQAVELPATISNLYTGLANMNGKDFTLKHKGVEVTGDDNKLRVSGRIA